MRLLRKESAEEDCNQTLCNSMKPHYQIHVRDKFYQLPAINAGNEEFAFLHWEDIRTEGKAHT